jgi:iron complex transport system substrate-binding protein
MLRTVAVCLLLAAGWTSLAIGAEALPQRWVSAGGSLSEWVVLLGGEGKLVGVDSTSRNPDSLRQLPSIGYQRQLAAEGILALRPDLLLGTEEMGPPPVLEQIAAAGVRVERFSAAVELPALQRNLERMGALLDAADRALAAFEDYRTQLQVQAGWVAQVQAEQEAPSVLLLLGHAGSSPMAAGKDTAAAWMIERAGGRNVTTHEGYKAISSESLLALDPQIVVFADRGLRGDAARQALWQQIPALASTRAGRDGRLVSMDPTLLVGGLGPRVPKAMAELSGAFYPDHQPPSPAAR